MEQIDIKPINELAKPIQYLGAKNRVIDSILNESENYIGEGYVLDLFSGSSIVSQAYSNIGKNVISNDVQKFSGIISKTFLKVDFEPSFLNFPLDILFKNSDNKYFGIYADWIKKEDFFLKKRDTKSLLNLYKNFPLIWNRKNNKSEEVNNIFEKMITHLYEPAFNIAPLFTTIYAGTYFGIKQSIQIDNHRRRLEELLNNDNINSWQYNLVLTSLISTISQIVNSAGKHFAQPIKFENILKNDLLESRLYKNRLIDIDSVLSENIINNISLIKNNTSLTKNIVISKTMESVIENIDVLPKIDLIYADPPYTAQQYSRFYHIPEILIEYKIPELQIHRDKVTTGLYPSDKFKSRFCSMVKAPEAFSDLFKLTKNTESTLLLSYSKSLSEDNGNKRMITIDQLEKLKDEIIPNYQMQIVELDLKYKQLNNHDSINQKTDSIEVLIVFSKDIINL
ncbi:DNA adenine methylase [Maribacter sp. MAR_2009_72]|uniref:DNA adenine methylase n=1 Tax=Maribacter sp. MAR_2009_72 TaxID=1250050 RepID=UPI001199E654|nr:DNA adenine methylase [Maribacter sp. MAR_2009_72]TVZ16400.1 adenine-specific DNA methylase [Maribacter sp. MAR_2009_72]